MVDRTSLDSSRSNSDDSEMAPLNPTTTTVEDLDLPTGRAALNSPDEPYKLYKKRFFGLFVLVMLNIIVSWDVCLSNSIKFSCPSLITRSG